LIFSIGTGDYCKGELKEEDLPVYLSIKGFEVFLRKQDAKD